MNRTGYYDEKKTMYGNYGTVFLNDAQMFEATGISAKMKANKVEVPMCGTNSKKWKTVGWDGSGTLSSNKVSSRFIMLLMDNMNNGIETVCTLISKLTDPGNGGTERIKMGGVKFDEISIADWSSGKLGAESVPFTFETAEALDVIDPSTITATT